MATTTTVEPPSAFTPRIPNQLVPPQASEPEPIDQTEHYVRLPTIRTLTANLVVVGRLKPLPVPDLED